MYSRESLENLPGSTTSGQDVPPLSAINTDRGLLVHEHGLPRPTDFSPDLVKATNRKRTATEEDRNDLEEKCQAFQ